MRQLVLVKIDGWDLAILWESTAGNKFYALRCALTLARDERAKAAATATAPKEDAVAGIVMKALLVRSQVKDGLRQVIVMLFVTSMNFRSTLSCQS